MTRAVATYSLVRLLAALAFIVAMNAISPRVAIAGEDQVSDPEVARYSLPSGGVIRPVRRLDVTTVTDVGDACRYSDRSRVSEASALGCPFEDTTLGFSTQSNFENESIALSLHSAFGRRSVGAFALERQFNDYEAGTTRETTLGTIGAKVTAFEGRLKVESELGWSSEWRTPVANAPLFPQRTDKTNGITQAHKFDAKILDGPAARWSLTGRYTQTSEDYRPFVISGPMLAYGAQGHDLALNSKMRVGKWSLSAGHISRNNRFRRSEDWRLSVGRSGVDFRIREDTSSTTGQAFTDISLPVSHSKRRVLGLDLTPSAIFPSLALSDSALSWLLPVTMSVDRSERSGSRSNTSGQYPFDEVGWSALAIWSTPVGETLLSWDRAVQVRGPVGPESRISRDSTLMLDHSFDLGRWSLGANVMRVSGSAGGGARFRDDSNSMTYAGLEARYSAPGAPEVALSIGHDQTGFTSDGDDFRFSDRTLSMEARVDFTPLLRKVTGRSDMVLRLEGRADLGRSRYEFRFQNEVIDSEFEPLSAQGIMITFGMKLP